MSFGCHAGIAPTRRDLLKAISAGTVFGLLGGCRTDVPPSGACWVHPIIDVHCHFFNAADVPVVGLVKNVILGESEPKFAEAKSLSDQRALLNAFIVFLVALLSRAAPSPRKELAILERKMSPSRAEVEQVKRQQLEKAIRTIHESSRKRSAPEYYGLRFSVPPDFEGLLREFGVSEEALYRSGDELSEAETRALAERVKDRESVKRVMAFAMLMLDYREVLAREYMRIFAPDRERCISLITPSVLDFAHWLKEDASDPRDQVKVMDAIQVRIAQTTKVHMHSIVAYDPGRDVKENGSSLRLVKEAILDRGFIGVKIYPPMGFQPFGDPDERINRALLRLYNWCREEGVPIMAHAENSIGARCGYGKKASPAFWRRLLATNRYDDLRINLAHFGGFDEEMKKEQESSQACKEDQFSGESWEAIIGETIKIDKRANLYADISYLSELVSTDTREDYRASIRRALHNWIKTYDPQSKHLMFGTDWSMMAIEANYSNYVSSISQQLTLAGISPDQQQNIFWKNAARFLGLSNGSKSHARLLGYCRKRGLDTAWLSAFNV